MARITIQRDGLTLVGDREEPFGEVYDMALLCHGMMANRNTRLLKALADRLRDENVASVRFDFNGQGESQGSFKNTTILNELEDAHMMLQYMRTDPHVRHIFLIGHGQGAAVAALLAGLYPDLIKKLVLLAPEESLKETLLSQPLRTEKFSSFYFRLAAQLPLIAIASHFKGPVCLIHGSNDHVVSPNISKQYAAHYQNAVVHLISGGDHRFSDHFQENAIALTAAFVKPNFY